MNASSSRQRPPAAPSRGKATRQRPRVGRTRKLLLLMTVLGALLASSFAFAWATSEFTLSGHSVSAGGMQLQFEIHNVGDGKSCLAIQKIVISDASHTWTLPASASGYGDLTNSNNFEQFCKATWNEKTLTDTKSGQTASFATRRSKSDWKGNHTWDVSIPINHIMVAKHQFEPIDGSGKYFQDLEELQASSVTIHWVSGRINPSNNLKSYRPGWTTFEGDQSIRLVAPGQDPHQLTLLGDATLKTSGPGAGSMNFELGIGTPGSGGTCVALSKVEVLRYYYEDQQSYTGHETATQLEEIEPIFTRWETAWEKPEWNEKDTFKPFCKSTLGNNQDYKIGGVTVAIRRPQSNWEAGNSFKTVVQPGALFSSHLLDRDEVSFVESVRLTIVVGRENKNNDFKAYETYELEHDVAAVDELADAPDNWRYPGFPDVALANAGYTTLPAIYFLENLEGTQHRRAACIAARRLDGKFDCIWAEPGDQKDRFPVSIGNIVSGAFFNFDTLKVLMCGDDLSGYADPRYQTIQIPQQAKAVDPNTGEPTGGDIGTLVRDVNPAEFANSALLERIALMDEHGTGGYDDGALHWCNLVSNLERTWVNLAPAMNEGWYISQHELHDRLECLADSSGMCVNSFLGARHSLLKDASGRVPVLPNDASLIRLPVDESTLCGYKDGETGLCPTVLQASTISDVVSAENRMAFEFIEYGPEDATATQRLTVEYWDNLDQEGRSTAIDFATGKLDTPDFPANPAGILHWDRRPFRFNDLDNTMDHFGVRLRATLFPKVTGSYRFYIGADNRGVLYLSDDHRASGKREIARATHWRSANDWFYESTQVSEWVHLEEGQPYYIEALMTSDVNWGFVNVAWEGPGAAASWHGAEDGPIYEIGQEFLLDYYHDGSEGGEP